MFLHNINFRAKFSQNPALAETLKATNLKTLIEANPNDTYWGVGLSRNNEDLWESKNWRGKNMLRKLLEDLRQSFELVCLINLNITKVFADKAQLRQTVIIC